MLNATNTQQQPDFYFGRVTDISIQGLQRVRNGGRQLESYHNNQNEREYVRKIHNHQMLPVKLKFSPSTPWENVI